MFGISLLGMCFDLIQEEIMVKISWIGDKLGLLSETEDHTSTCDQNDQILGWKDFRVY